MGPASSPLITYVLRLADDNLVLGQQLGALISRMPELEEDIAVANIAIDHIGQARNLYQYVTELEAAVGSEDESSPRSEDDVGSRAAARSEDDLAMLRSEREFLNAVLVEQPNGDFANTMVRQFLFDAYQVPLFQELSSSSDKRLAAIAGKALKEAMYHLDHSSAWVITLGDGTSESHGRAQAALDDLWRFTADLFAADEVEDELIGAGVAADPAAIRPRFDQTVVEVTATANLTIPDDGYQRLGGRTGFHTEHLGHILAEMQHLYRSHPSVSW